MCIRDSAFDCAKVDQIEVKRFEAPFAFTTLDGTQRTVDENTLMICCKGQPVAIAGIMGGLDSEIEDDTDSLLLESANFDAVSVRKSSTRLGPVSYTHLDVYKRQALHPALPAGVQRGGVRPGHSDLSSLWGAAVPAVFEQGVLFSGGDRLHFGLCQGCLLYTSSGSRYSSSMLCSLAPSK